MSPLAHAGLILVSLVIMFYFLKDWTLDFESFVLRAIWFHFGRLDLPLSRFCLPGPRWPNIGHPVHALSHILVDVFPQCLPSWSPFSQLGPPQFQLCARRTRLVLFWLPLVTSWLPCSLLVRPSWSPFGRLGQL
jgi:hypothetical protein